MLLDGVSRDRGERLRRNASPPERLAQPVPDLRRNALDIMLQHIADATDRLAADRDREERLRDHLARRADEAATVAMAVRKRKAITQVDPDIAVVGVAHQRLEIGGTPGAHVAPFKGENHTRRPNHGRRRVPSMLPANADANHTQPCTLDDAMPLKYAPMLHP